MLLEKIETEETIQGANVQLSQQPKRSFERMKFQPPLSLKRGDKVAIVSSSSGMPFLFPWVYKQGLERLKSIFQLEPVEFPTALQSPEYLSGIHKPVQKISITHLLTHLSKQS